MDDCSARQSRKIEEIFPLFAIKTLILSITNDDNLVIGKQCGYYVSHLDEDSDVTPRRGFFTAPLLHHLLTLSFFFTFHIFMPMLHLPQYP
jgi:hypothetical protein